MLKSMATCRYRVPYQTYQTLKGVGGDKEKRIMIFSNSANRKTTQLENYDKKKGYFRCRYVYLFTLVVVFLWLSYLILK